MSFQLITGLMSRAETEAFESRRHVRTAGASRNLDSAELTC